MQAVSRDILMTEEQRSGCPINLTLEVVGDKWSLLVIRDMIFGNRRHFRELLTRSEEGIRARLLEEGGPKLWADFMEELRETHLGVKRRRKGPSVNERLQKAYEAVVARRKAR
jgi:hypothetical protein